ncbi:MAG: hypothetical protein J1E39_03155, partial [Eubacterium sp.]|nr:hypothetical protein [Eubacterium sp.]
HVDGQLNEVTGNYHTVSGQLHTVGGAANDVSGYRNGVDGSYNLIGGQENGVSGTANVGAGLRNKLDRLDYSMFFGDSNSVSGNAQNDLIGGEHNTLSGNGSTVNGRSNIVSGCDYTIVHGHHNNVTDTNQSAVIGAFNTVSGARNNATVMGWYNTLSDSSTGAFVTGEFNTTSGEAVTVAGAHNEVSHSNNTVFGKFNIDKDLALCIGNGTGAGDTPRSNALELDWDGNLHISGKLIADGGIDGGGGDGSSVEISDIIDDNSTNDTAAGSKAVYDFVKAAIADNPPSALPVISTTLYAQSAAAEISVDGEPTQVFRLKFNAAADCVPLLNVTAQYTLTDSGTMTFTVVYDGREIARFSQVSPVGDNFRSFAVPIIGTDAGTHEISVYVGGADGTVTDTGYAVLTGYGLSETEDDEPTEDKDDEPDIFAAKFKADHATFTAEVSVGGQLPLKIGVAEKLPPQKAEIAAKMKGDNNA